MSNFHRTAANATLLALALCYVILLGGGNYEHLNVTMVAASAPPKSLAMLQGQYGFTPKYFWMVFRPITEVLFLLAIAFNWKTTSSRKRLLLTAFGIDVLLTVVTFTYFAPETGVIAKAAFTDTVDPVLQGIARRWQNLNFLRLVGFYVASVLLLLGLTLPIVPKSSR